MKGTGLMKTPVVLVVDDEEQIVTALRGSLEDEGYIVMTASDGMKAVEIIQAQPVDMVFLDVWLPEMDGIETLKKIKEFNSAIDVIMMTGHGTVNTAVQAVKLGAFDFLEKPFSLDTVIDSIKKIKEKKHVTTAKGKSSATSHEEQMLALTGSSPNIVKLRELIPQLAAEDGHVLLHGEVGTGKELVAGLIHTSSHRKSHPLIKFNASFHLTKELEKELLGIREQGSVTADAGGLLHTCSGSTFFLESLLAIPIEVQKRLAAYLKSHDVKQNDIRIIAAVAYDVERGIEEHSLDEDFVACFSHKIKMPCLRQRRQDIPVLLNLFVKYFCNDYGLREKRLEEDALETLLNYDWPGNVKELKNLVEKLVVSVPTKVISLHDIPLSIRDGMHYGMARYYERFESMKEAEIAWRKQYLLYYLRKHDRDIVKTSQKLKIDIKKLKKYIKDYGIILSQENRTERKMQRTLKRSMVLSGRGLHSGDKTGLIITPLPPNSGILFGSISTGMSVPAHIDYVESTDYATSLRNTDAVARTIEHFLAVLHAYRITNLMIKINNEVPIMDGSSVDFCQIIEDAGIKEQNESCEEVVITEQYTVGEIGSKSKFITIEPADKLSINYTLDYPKPVGHQEYSFVLDGSEVFKREIAPARTFGFLRDMEALEKKGLGGGGRLSNFILIDDEKIINTDLRFPDEFVRHKIMDMLGDLYLIGRPIRGKITANMTGHSENIELVRLLCNSMHL